MIETKPEKPEAEAMTVRFPKGMLDVLRASAEANDRSLNAEIINALRARVYAYQSQEGIAVHV